jgi:hypothetical protein
MGDEIKAIYRNEYYKDLRRWLISRYEMYKGQITDAEFSELSADAVAEFQATLKEQENG